MACWGRLIIEPIFEAYFCDSSYGFRPKKSARDAVDDIATALWAGYTKVIDADLSKYFDSIPHTKLLAVVAERVVDGGILHVIKQWLKAPVVGEDENGVKQRGSGLRRFPSRHLYQRYGLYKVPADAGWKSAHAVA